MSDHRTPDAPGMWKAAHGGYGVMFDDDGEPAMLLFGPGAKVRALDSIGPYTRLHPGIPVGSAPVPNLPGRVDGQGREPVGGVRGTSGEDLEQP